MSLRKDLVDVLIAVPSTPETGCKTTVTEQIPVPTSEHVAQIVGKCGSKIKFLRSQTNTCIKTPFRGEEPVFVVSGEPSDVRRAVDAIQKASQHFTRLIESRSKSCAIGEFTIEVEVPHPYVGAVVGRNGAVITRIKQLTNTRINTPKGGDLHPKFEVTGTRVNVMAAREAIHQKVVDAYCMRNK
ncbi:unnamed protein product [Medioppia subpectinata]|uniref:K Homology domain-containing protein n=1 Tax=Medioppia subpectinata TaxID=1979941 RepID=A0A7R9L2R4_9ACAR|nr:unnamed protein product [Medioppia subpectinata]CAG2114167.1 unnamed protein product [Medioppia subpectinata]